MKREQGGREASRVAADGGAPTANRRLIGLLVLAIVAVASFIVVPASSPVGAVSRGAQVGKLVSADPVNNTPHVLDGYVRTFAEVGNTVVVGGNFTKVRTDASPTEIPRSYLFAFDRTTGAVTSFAPTINGEVFQVLSTGDGQTVWVAGGFSNVNGQVVRSLVKLDITTGQRVAAFVPPAFNGRIHDMALRNGRLVLTGRFTSVGGAAQTLLAAVDPMTGANIVGFNSLVFSEPRSGGTLSVFTSDITPDGTSLIAAGNFTKINGAVRYQIAKIDLSTGTPVLADWATNRYGNGCSSSFDSYMRDVEISPDGSYFVAVTTGAYSSTFLCDAAARFDIDVQSLAADPVWTNYTGGDTLTAVAVTETAVYTGGHNGWMNNPYAADAVGAGAVTREGLAALDPRSGAVMTWDPERTLGYGVYGFVATDSGLWIGSDTDRIGNWEYHGRMAFMPLATGMATPEEFTGLLPAQTVTLNDGSVTSRQFTGSSVTSSSTAAASWTGLRGAFMISGKLYTGWSDRTLRVQTYDGTTFGPRTTIPLQLIPTSSASLNRFASQDLPSLTSMFYDPATGRIYYTKSGIGQLFYRSFSPESNIVGAERQEGVGNFTGLSWQNVRGAFLVDDELFTVDTFGRLWRWNWTSTGGPADINSNLSPTSYSGRPVAGTGVQVSGPGVDSQNWLGRDTFVYADAAGAPNQLPVADIDASCTDNVCELDAAGSTDSDGSIASYLWDFGDGTTTGAGVTANHVYAASGTFTVTLTVVDDKGGVDTEQAQVTVTVANVNPTANFTSGCTGLSCSFDAATSGDPDGTIVDYAWDFGDGTAGTGVAATHDYEAAGTYTASLTVTDDRGGQNTTTSSVSVVDPNHVPTVSFVGAASVAPNSSLPTVTVPAAVAEGDTLLLIATVASDTATVTGPAGWTLVESVTDATATVGTYLWTKTAAPTDGGSNAVVTLSALQKSSLHVLAYRGADGITAAAAIDTVSRAERTTPVVEVTAPGSMVVSYWADKSSATTGWTLPAEVTLRDQVVGTGSGRVVAAAGDTGPLGAGAAGGLTAVADSANRRGVLWSIVVAADLAAPNLPPTAAFEPACSNLACTFDATGSVDGDGTIDSYAWEYGDGTTGSATPADHTYAAAGTYTITLTVTDDDGATGSTQRQVTVSDAPAAVVAFRAAASGNANTSAPRAVVPDAVAAGDVMVMIATVNTTTPTVSGPDGWTLLESVVNPGAGVQTHAWTKIATATDAGTSVGPNLSALGKVSVELIAYDNAAGVSAHAVNLETTTSASRTTPAVAVASGGSALISYWADKSSSTTTWAVPAGTTLRDVSVGAGSGRVTAAIADTGSLAPGTAGGFTATADSASGRGIVWSVVVAPGA